MYSEHDTISGEKEKRKRDKEIHENRRTSDEKKKDEDKGWIRRNPQKKRNQKDEII
jgi:hypothetical protein